MLFKCKVFLCNLAKYTENNIKIRFCATIQAICKVILAQSQFKTFNQWLSNCFCVITLIWLRFTKKSLSLHLFSRRIWVRITSPWCPDPPRRGGQDYCRRWRRRRRRRRRRCISEMPGRRCSVGQQGGTPLIWKQRRKISSTGCSNLSSKRNSLIISEISELLKKKSPKSRTGDDVNATTEWKKRKKLQINEPPKYLLAFLLFLFF